jgi:predicted nuclease of predicted toxin-antitoxin system
MRLLANENFPGPAVSALRAAGHDVVWIHEDAPGIKDPEVMARARAEDRVLLTFDKDFGELVFHLGEKASNGIVLFRIMGPSPEDLTRIVMAALQSRTDWANQFSVVEAGRIRIRPLPKVP